MVVHVLERETTSNLGILGLILASTDCHFSPKLLVPGINFPMLIYKF